jgi:CheY-like chemotaxis protein
MTSKHIKILLVEDDESNRLCLRDYLEQEGFICHEAENGAEGLVKLQSEAFDVVITDLNMPIMDGFQLLDALANSPSLKRIPVLIVTGKSFPDEVKQKALHPCLIDILPKPYDFPKISRSLAALFS